MDTSPFSVAARRRIRAEALARDNVSPAKMFDRERPNGRVAHHEAKAPDETVDHSTIILEAFAHLTPRQQQVMALRYGLVSGYELTQVDVALRLGISRDTVATMEARAMRRLRWAFDTDVA